MFLGSELFKHLNKNYFVLLICLMGFKIEHKVKEQEGFTYSSYILNRAPAARSQGGLGEMWFGG